MENLVAFRCEKPQDKSDKNSILIRFMHLDTTLMTRKFR